MILFKYEGKEYEFPTKWPEMNFRLYIKLIPVKDKITAVKVILEHLGIPTDGKIENLEEFMKMVSFLAKPPEIEDQPTRIGEYTFPQNIGGETIEQLNKTQELAKSIAIKPDDTRTEMELIIDRNEAFPYYAAIYCQGMNEPFDPVKANALAEKFKDLPCVEVMSAGSFFQDRFESMQTGRSINSLRAGIPLRRRPQGLRKLMKNLASMVRSTVSRDM